MQNQDIEEKIHETVSSEPMEGFDSVLMPGELEHIQKKKNEKHGIPISKELFDELKEVGRKYGVEIQY